MYRVNRLPKMFLKVQLVADLLGVEGQSHALDSTNTPLLSHLATLFEQGCAQALVLVTST
jgi:hypothetical protein